MTIKIQDVNKVEQALKDLCNEDSILRITGRGYLKKVESTIDSTGLACSNGGYMEIKSRHEYTSHLNLDVSCKHVVSQALSSFKKIKEMIEECDYAEISFRIWYDPIRRTRRKDYCCGLRVERDQETITIDGDLEFCIKTNTCHVDGRPSINYFERCRIREILKEYFL